MSIVANLYPPVVLDAQPSFNRNNACRIYFALPVYNSYSDIKNVQISIVNQKTNLSEFSSSAYPCEIKLAAPQVDESITTNYKYYVVIEPADLVSGNFKLNQFYKIQLRFTSVNAAAAPNSKAATADWLYANRDYFSEWSSVCLIKGIQQPLVYLNDFEDSAYTEQKTILANPIITVAGKLYYKNQVAQKEYLKSYNIKIYDVEQNTLVWQSQEIYADSYNLNQFNYEINYSLTDGIDYVMELTYTTNNAYVETLTYNFVIISYGIDRINATITATPDEENGSIRINIQSSDNSNFFGNLTIRRTSSESDFHYWEDVRTEAYFTQKQLDYEWNDYTIKSGVWYKYCVQRRNSLGYRGAIVQIDNPVMCIFDHMYLTKAGQQLKIQFNPSLNEFKYNVTESQQVTIGGKYPFIKRNGNNYYRSFPIGGLISSLIDMTDWYDPHYYNEYFHNDENEIKAFTSKEKIYGESASLYADYNNTNNISEYKDYIYEREFRQKVYDFLYANDVKLFRSTTQGNILIKLMNIDFQPVASLGRMLYSFTATAIEVDAANTMNYDKYNIQQLGEYQTYLAQTKDILGQIQGTYSNNENLLNTVLKTKHEKVTADSITAVNYLKWLRIEITSEPYVVYEQNGSLIKVTNTNNIDPSQTTVGYVVEINGREFIIRPSMIRRNENTMTAQPQIVYVGFFELKDDDLQIKSLSFKYPATAMIDYIVNMTESENTSNFVKSVEYFTTQGQLYQNFTPRTSIIKQLYRKYLLNYSSYYQKLLSLNGVRIESEPGTVIYVKDSKDNGLERHVIPNGYLQLQDDEATIDELYFYGIHLTQTTNKDVIKNNEYYLVQDKFYGTFDDVLNPINHGVYRFFIAYLNELDINRLSDNLYAVIEDKVVNVSNQNYALIIEQVFSEYIYYNGQWYPFASTQDVLCQIDGIVDYSCEIVKGFYER